MEKFAAVFVALGALLVATVSLSEAETENRYFKAGGELRLSPVPVSGQIYSIVWKYDKNLLAEWEKPSIDLTYYSKFKGRSELNISTGVLVVQSMTANDIGRYSVEINHKVQSQDYQTVEIFDVPEPTVSVKPLACGSASESCRLICEGNITQAGPVTYFWRKDDGEWEKLNNALEIFNNKETQNVETFSCRLENPVSQKKSEPVKNPFYRDPETPSGGGNGGVVAGVILPILVILAAVIAAVILYKRKLLCFKNIDRVPVSMKEIEPASTAATPGAATPGAATPGNANGDA